MEYKKLKNILKIKTNKKTKYLLAECLDLLYLRVTTIRANTITGNIGTKCIG